LVYLRQIVLAKSDEACFEEMRNTLEYFIRKPEWKSSLGRTRLGGRKILKIGYFEYKKKYWALKRGRKFHD
jgi:hypothetical protein